MVPLSAPPPESGVCSCRRCTYGILICHARRETTTTPHGASGLQWRLLPTVNRKSPDALSRRSLCACLHQSNTILHSNTQIDPLNRLAGKRAGSCQSTPIFLLRNSGRQWPPVGNGDPLSLQSCSPACIPCLFSMHSAQTVRTQAAS